MSYSRNGGGYSVQMVEFFQEGKNTGRDCKIVFVGDATQVMYSLMMITTKLGMDFVQYWTEKNSN